MYEQMNNKMKQLLETHNISHNKNNAYYIAIECPGKIRIDSCVCPDCYDELIFDEELVEWVRYHKTRPTFSKIFFSYEALEEELVSFPFKK